MRTRLSVFCDKIIEAGWLAAVIVVPLFFNIYSQRVFEPDKLTLLRSIAVVMSVAWAIREVEDWRANQGEGDSGGTQATFWQRVRETPLVLPTLFLVFVYLVSTATSVVPRVSFWGSYQRLQGTYTTLSYVVIFFLALQGLRTKRQLNRLITVMVLVSFPIALYALIQHFGLDPLPWGGDVTTRVAANMGNAIFVAAYLIMLVPLTLSRLLQNWKKTVGHLNTRDGVLGFVAFVLLAGALLVGMLWRVEGGGPWLRWAALLIGIGLQAPIYLLSPEERRPRVLAISLPLTFAFLVGFSWVLEIFFPPASPNFFWLGLVASVIFLLAMFAFAYYLRRPVSRLLLLAGYFVILIAQIVAIFYTQSRGPLLGLLAGVFFYLALLGLVKGRVWISWLMSALVVVVLVFLVMFNTVESSVMEILREVPYVGRLGKVLQTETGTGKVRVLIWEGAVEMIGWHAPLESAGVDGGQDPFNLLRPIVGYGPESMYVAYNRFYPPDLAHFERRNASPDRSHNETFDALVFTGTLGLVAYMWLFISVFYYGLKWLGLIRERRQRLGFMGLLVGGGIAGGILTWAWRGPPYVGLGLPLGTVGGLAVYIFVVLLSATLRPRGKQDRLQAPLSGVSALGMLALLSAVLAHFIEINFGIAIAATRTYFWVFAAMMVVIGTRLAVEPAAQGNTEKATEAAAERADRVRERPVQRDQRERRRHKGAAPELQPLRAGNPDWLGEVLVLGVVSILILCTMIFDFVTVQAGNPGPLVTIWASLTRAAGESSPVMLVLLFVTWAMIALVGLSDLATRPESADRKPAAWLVAVGILGFVSLAGALIFALLHALQLKPVTITAVGEPNPLANTISVYYLVVMLAILALALVLASLFQRRTRAWLWTRSLGDVAVIAVAVLLPLLAATLILITNVNVVRADVLHKQGLSSEKAKLLDGAIFFYDQSLALAEDQDHYYLFLGKAYMEKGSAAQGAEQEAWLQESERALLKAREIAPLNTDHSANLARLHSAWARLTQGEERAEHLGKAVGYYSDATTLSPNSAHLFNEWAQTYHVLGDLDRAEEMYDRSLSLDDEFEKTYVFLADLYQARGKEDEAIKSYERAIEIKPESLQAYLLLAQLHIKSEEWDEAARVYQRAIKASPRAADAYSGLGYVYSQVGDLESALAAYLTTVDLRPRSFNERKNLAILYQQMGRTEDAIREGNRALDLASVDQRPAIEGFLSQLDALNLGASAEDSGEVQQLIAQGSTQMGAEDWDAAEETFEAVLKLAPDNSYGHSALAYVYAKQGRLDEAIVENEVVVELMPDDYNSFKNLALLYDQKGDMESAIGATEKALLLAPENEVQALQIFLQQIRQRQGEPSPSDRDGVPGRQDQRAGELSPVKRNSMYGSPPPVIIEPSKAYQATIATEKGDIVLELYAGQAPETVNNFVFLAREGFYDGTTFHRVIPGFMAQAGDPTGTGTGGPGYAFADEFDATLRHDGPGVLSMANAGPDTNGSQFFITYEAAPWLDDLHAVFGRVTEGMDVLESLTPRDPQQNPALAGDGIRTITVQEE